MIEELGGKPTEGIGFAVGLERLIMIMKAQGLCNDNDSATDIFVASIGDKADIFAQKLVYDLRKRGVAAERDLCGRSVKAQMKFANKLNSKYSIVLGDDEIDNNSAKLKNMDTGESFDVELTAEKLAEIIK